MRRRDLVAGCSAAIAVALAMLMSISAPFHAVSARGGPGRRGQCTLTREIQFMLSRLGIDPGPIDGIAGQQHLRPSQIPSAVRFAGGNLVSGGKISAAFLERLRSEASRLFSGREKRRASSGASGSFSLTVSVNPAQPTAPAPDPLLHARFKSGGTFRSRDRVHPDKFLQVGLTGRPARAWPSLTTPDSTKRARRPEALADRPSAKCSGRLRILAYFQLPPENQQGSDARKRAAAPPRGP